jgi:glycerophosphoryl diester phosphodiesterase
MSDFFSGSRHNLDVIAHRGGNGEWPGETIFAFEKAKALGVDVLEMDLRVTRDHQLVLMHNPTVAATTNGTLPVRCYRLAELQQLDAGYDWSPEGQTDHPFRHQGLFVPTFHQVLEQFKDMRMNIEIKGWHPIDAKKIAGHFCDLLEDYGMTERVLVASFHRQVLRVIRKRRPEVAISASTIDVIKFVLSSRFGSGSYRPDAEAIQTQSTFIDAKLLETCRKHGLKLHGWTVNKVEEMDRLIALGVDGIITDFPTKLLNRPGVRKEQ